MKSETLKKNNVILQLTYLGINSNSSLMERRVYSFCNVIGLLCVVLFSFSLTVNFIVGFRLSRSYSDISILTIGFSILLLNHFQKVEWSKVLICFLIPGIAILSRHINYLDYFYRGESYYSPSSYTEILSLSVMFIMVILNLYSFRIQPWIFVMALLVNLAFLHSYSIVLALSEFYTPIPPPPFDYTLIYLAIIALWVVCFIISYSSAKINHNIQAKLEILNEEMRQQQEEISTQNEELRQSQEELMAQKEFIEQQNKELSESNQKVKANEEILKKALVRVKESQEEISTQNEELRQSQEELMAQKEFIEQQNRELNNMYDRIKTNEDILKKALTKLQESQINITKQNELLIEKDKRIGSSIKVAQFIQQSILPDENDFEELFKDCFVLYKPKDSVSGDFYFLQKIQDKILLIVADCTGHGVPGAFITIVGKYILDRVIHERKVDKPGQILAHLHNEIQESLQQKKTRDNHGMDAAVVCLQKNENGYHIEYASAKIPIYYFNPEQEGLQTLKADRQSIGGWHLESNIDFKNHQLDLPSSSIIYIGSDGLTDQNDERRKRFGVGKLTQILEENRHHTLKKQKEILSQSLDEYQGNEAQRDDIMLIGIKL